jgi:cytochrome c oxidase cbb3-type subunit 3
MLKNPVKALHHEGFLAIGATGSPGIVPAKHYKDRNLLPGGSMRQVGRFGIIVAVALIFALSAWADALRGNPTNGQTIYEKNCLRCHGKNLDGQGPDARTLIVPPANLQALQSRAKTDWELLITISHGIMFSPMHGWRERLTQDQIMDVLSYIRMMAPFDAVS